MVCREAERSIGAFLEDRLNTAELEAFIQHIDNCDSCLEELSIQYLVETGMKRLEDGDTFDLQKELDRRLEMARRRIIRRKRIAGSIYALEMCVIFLVTILIIMVIIK